MVQCGDRFWVVSSRILRVKFKISRVKVFVVVGYGPSEEGKGEERERFGNDLDKTVDRVGNGYRSCMLGDLNRHNGDRVKAGITDAFGVSGENEGSRAME